MVCNATFNNINGRRMLFGTHLVQWAYMHCVPFRGVRAQIAHAPTNCYIKHMLHSMLLSIWKSIKIVSLKLFPNVGG
jgi:hypothetical protein